MTTATSAITETPVNWSARRINRLASALGAKHYTEIGVYRGITFHAVAVQERVAVDPKFGFKTTDFENKNTRFFETTSDKYFAELERERASDLYFIDGLHTFEQTLRDFNNSIIHSHSRTVWLIDDTYPGDVYSTLNDYKRAFFFRHRTGNKSVSWHGDVFKLIFYIHDFMPSLNYRTLIGNGNGQTLVWRSNQITRTPSFGNLEAISRLTYFDFCEELGIMRTCSEDEAIKECVDELMTSKSGGVLSREVVADRIIADRLDRNEDTSERRITTLADVYIEPYVFEPFQLQPRKAAAFRGGIEEGKADRFGRVVSGGNYRDHPQPRKAITGLPIPGRSLYAGPLWNHFGHILTESIHRLWPLVDGRYDRVVFTGVIGLRGVTSADALRRAEVPPVAEAIFEAMELPDVELFLVREPTIFEALDVPEPGARYRDGIEPFYLKYLHVYQGRITNRLPHYIGPKNIYYSRRHILGQGGIIGSRYFEEVMARVGVVSIIPEKMTLDTQLSHLLNAERIVFDEGSSVHLVELLANLPGTFYMLPRRPRDNVFCAAFRDRAPFYNLANDDNVGLLPDKYGATTTPSALAFYKRPEEVFEALTQHGLVAGSFDRAKYIDCEAADRQPPRSAMSRSILLGGRSWRNIDKLKQLPGA